MHKRRANRKRRVKGIRAKRTVYATDEKWDLIGAYAEQRGRSISNFLIETAMSEITRHAAKPAFRELVKELVLEVIKDCFPSKGEAIGGILKRDRAVRKA